MTPDIALYFRNQLRDARAAAFRDAEGFQEILFALERLGSYQHPGGGGLGDYRKAVEAVAAASSLADGMQRDWHVPFAELYEAIRIARNDALHQGAFARHLTEHAIQLSLILEDALMAKVEHARPSKVADYMVREPVCALPWQPISFIRQQMLANSFSYLPVRYERSKKPTWGLISDWSIARCLPRDPNKRTEYLKQTLESVINAGDIKPIPVKCFTSATSIEDVLAKSNGRPILVIDKAHPEYLVGILTPFDLL